MARKAVQVRSSALISDRLSLAEQCSRVLYSSRISCFRKLIDECREGASIFRRCIAVLAELGQRKQFRPGGLLRSRFGKGLSHRFARSLRLAERVRNPGIE